LYRVAVARAHGITLWDSQWYGGHWTLNYSVLFPVTAAFVGVGVLSVLCAAASALAFDRLVVGQLGRYARLGSAVFAVSVIVETSIGQLTFFFGEALALWCLVAATRRHWWLASAAAAASSLVSPLAGAFAGLALFVWWLSLSDWSAPRMSLRGAPLRVLGVAVAGFLPIAATSVLFPGQGTMPYPLTDWVWEMGVALILWTITPYAQRVLRVGIVVYAIAATLCVLIPSPVGGNIGRLEDCLALPLAAVACWDRDPAGRPFNRFGRLAQRLLQPRAALAVVAIPLALSQWAPAWPAITTDPGRPSTHKAYYTPLLRWLDHAPGPLARVEVVPTADHWEAAYVAPTIPLARGWERQLDIADNPIFYTPGALNAQTYLSWLRDNGVRYVALSDAPLDYAGVTEAHLVEAGVPGLDAIWHNNDWKVYQVVGSSGIVSGPARLTDMEGGTMTLDVARPGPILVRVRWNANWQVSNGDGTIIEAPGGWMTVVATHPGVVHLDISF